ncbi:MAG: hypothetical protein KJ876_07245 [Alphaproteobacteria bacterium]|jgi:hypothetical protein|uniref:Ribbon-helix-helix protein CopG domain-containing protein n=1 Tax=Novosphingobium subterraneum TaxID=48936 RepID=A0A0B9AG17_9SPHN|nr:MULTISPECIES: hypothetical protein [Sphingomonadales]MBA4045625.1 hypothetical protein [Erythrobacter sp.]MBU0774419.1 hypothetical protein [Alphaproteobacteria bacterium]MCH2240266.1 hypothetical protein [Blastomonas sp.]OHC92757.1 MAG: hypothetical protein A2792_15835 [Sphingomonadales bacterium RIFCSPHIGHO2_01_FULL_65_20]KHS49376.1 hypothetical protein NJ75_00079 [Novosphingobium subterraneum]
MGKVFKGIGIGLSEEVLRELDAFATSKGVSRAEAIRASIAVGLPLLNLGIALNAERALTILEHTQLALSLLVERQYPEDVNELIDMALRNVREYHA